jgi:predicted nucleic acid-binding protein
VNVLVDTSVWVGHFKRRNELLAGLLEDGMVICHPHVVVEVACGTPPHRRAIVHMLAELESVPVATHEELLTLIERQPLYGRGCGFVDVSLIASVLLSENTLIWTLDKRLDMAAAELGRSYRYVRQ